MLADSKIHSGRGAFCAIYFWYSLPAGIVQRPLQGSMPLLHINILPSCSQMTPTTCISEFVFLLIVLTFSILILWHIPRKKLSSQSVRATNVVWEVGIEGVTVGLSIAIRIMSKKFITVNVGSILWFRLCVGLEFVSSYHFWVVIGNGMTLCTDMSPFDFISRDSQFYFSPAAWTEFC